MNVAGTELRGALIALTLSWVTTACAGPRPLALPGREGGPREMPGAGSTRGRGTWGDEVGLAAKHVAGKEPPSTLIAEDGSRCSATERQYRETSIGEKALCAWRTGSRAP
jgi:hypothetical protein